MKKYTLVVIDDDVIIGKAVERLLTRNGHSVMYFRSADPILNYLKLRDEVQGDLRPIDAVLCDEEMQGMTGSDLLQELRKAKSPYVDKFIFHTGLKTMGTHKGRPAVMRKGVYASIISAIERMEEQNQGLAQERPVVKELWDTTSDTEFEARVDEACNVVDRAKQGTA